MYCGNLTGICFFFLFQNVVTFSFDLYYIYIFFLPEISTVFLCNVCLILLWYKSGSPVCFAFITIFFLIFFRYYPYFSLWFLPVVFFAMGCTISSIIHFCFAFLSTLGIFSLLLPRQPLWTLPIFGSLSQLLLGFFKLTLHCDTISDLKCRFD